MSNQSQTTREARGLGRETLIYAIATISTGITGFIGAYIFSRLLNVDEYGLYFLVLATGEMVRNITASWIYMCVMRYYPAVSAEDRPVFLGRILAANLYVTAILVILAVLAVPVVLILKADPLLPWIVLGLTVPTVALGFIQNLFRTRRQPVDWTLTYVIVSWGRLGLGWLLLTQVRASGLMLTLALAGVTVVAVVYGIIRFNERIEIRLSSFSLKELKPLLDYGMPGAVVNAGSWFMASAGRLILGLLAGAGAVGIYSPAYQLCFNLVQIPVTPLNTSSMPVSIRVFEKEGREAAARFMTDLIAVSLTISAGMGMSAYLLRHEIVGALLDPDYASSANLVGYLMPAISLMLLHPLLIKSFQFSEKTAMLSWYTLGAGALNIGLNFLLIPVFRNLGSAEAGVAISSLVTYSAYSVITYLGGRRLFQWSIPFRQLATLLVPLAILIAMDRIVPRPSGLVPTFLAGLGYVLVFILAALTAMRVCGGEVRGHLSFLRQIFRRQA